MQPSWEVIGRLLVGDQLAAFLNVSAVVAIGVIDVARRLLLPALHLLLRGTVVAVGVLHLLRTVACVVHRLGAVVR